MRKLICKISSTINVIILYPFNNSRMILFLLKLKPPLNPFEKTPKDKVGKKESDRAIERWAGRRRASGSVEVSPALLFGGPAPDKVRDRPGWLAAGTLEVEWGGVLPHFLRVSVLEYFSMK